MSKMYLEVRPMPEVARADPYDAARYPGAGMYWDEQIRLFYYVLVAEPLHAAINHGSVMSISPNATPNFVEVQDDTRRDGISEDALLRVLAVMQQPELALKLTERR